MEHDLAYFDRSPGIVDSYRTGVSLHSHTLHSTESALPMGKLPQGSAVARALVGRAHRRYGGRPLEEDLSRMWWTPPLAPGQALDVEVGQMRRRGRQDRTAVLGYVSRLSTDKNLRLLKRVENALRAEGYLDYRFEIVGYGSDAE